MSAVKKLHHYVPRFYLQAWAEKDLVYCLQRGRISHPNVRNVAAENYFYRLEELDSEDLDFLRKAIIENSPEALKPVHEELLRAFAVPHETRRRIEASGRMTPGASAQIERTIIELNENLHASIEDKFRPYLNEMIAGSLEFLHDSAQVATFYWGLAVQYARTNHIKQTRLVMDPARRERYRRITNPLVHLVATNVGRSLFAEREWHKIMLLENATRLPFVTADQPVINLAAMPNDAGPPEKFELYYPLSPTKAMLLLGPSSDFDPGDSCVTETFVLLHNLRMAAHSYRQVFSNSQQALELVRDELSAYMSCFPERGTKG